MVKFLVLLRRDFRARPRPEGRGDVDRLFLVAVGEHDRQRDVVGVALDDLPDALRIEVFLVTLADMQHDAQAARHVRGRLYRKAALAVRGPAPALGLSRFAAQHLDLVGDHEGGIEADPELADQAHILLGVAGQLADKGRCARARDRAEIFDQLVVVHADAVIGDGQGSRRLHWGHHDAIARVALGKRGLSQRGVAQPVAGVGRVRDQLAQEDLLLAIERVRDDIEEAADFRLEAARFGFGFGGSFRRGIQGHCAVQACWGTAAICGPHAAAARHRGALSAS